MHFLLSSSFQRLAVFSRIVEEILSKLWCAVASALKVSEERHEKFSDLVGCRTATSGAADIFCCANRSRDAAGRRRTETSGASLANSLKNSKTCLTQTKFLCTLYEGCYIFMAT